MKASKASVSLMVVPSSKVRGNSPLTEREFTSPPENSWSRDSRNRSQPCRSISWTQVIRASRSPYWVPLLLGSWPSSFVQ